MREGPDASVLATAARWGVRVASWQGPDLRAEDIPVAAGVWDVSASRQVPELLDLTVPAGSRGEWIPGADPEHPLARYGQTLDVTVVVADAAGRREWEVPLGRAVIQDWSAPDPGDVEVKASGVLQRVADDRLPSPESPDSTATLISEFRRLITPGIPVEVLVDDRAAPQSFTWDEDRLGALYDIADSLPATLKVTAEGGVLLDAPLPATVPAPVITWTDGEGGTVVSAPRSDTRTDAYNAVVARGQASDPDAAAVQAEAQVTEGPMAVGGPYGPVRRFYASPLLTTTGQCLAAAQSILATSVVPSRTVTVTCASDPRVELWDPVAAVRDGVTYHGWVVAYRLPLTVAGGPMTVQIGIGG